MFVFCPFPLRLLYPSRSPLITAKQKRKLPNNFKMRKQKSIQGNHGLTPPTSNGHRLTLTFGEGMSSVSVANSSTFGLYSFSLPLPSSSSMDPTASNRLDKTHKLNEGCISQKKRLYKPCINLESLTLHYHISICV